MKIKSILVLILTALTLTSYCQKIQIKDGIILKDKQPVAKLDGKAALIKGTHVRINNLNDEPLITIDEKVAKYGSHFQEPLHFIKITFVPFNGTIYRLDLKSTSEKKLVGFLYDRIGKDFLTKDGLNKEKIVAFTLDNDHAEKIHGDTTKTGAVVSGYLEGIKQPGQPRDRNAPIEFSAFPEDKLKWQGYVGNSGHYFDRSVKAIYQGKVLIGVLVKNLVRGDMNATNYHEASYYILKKIKSFEANGETFEYAPLALLKTSSQGQLSTQITIENEGMRAAPKVNDFRNAETVLIDTLIREGLL